MSEYKPSSRSDKEKDENISFQILPLSSFEDPPHIDLEKPKTPWQNPQPTHYQSIGIGLTLSYSLIMSPLSGMLIGWLIEQKYKDSNAITWGLALGAILGFITIFLTLNKNK